MRHRWQSTSVWALVAYFGALSLLGPGWHCAFGAHSHCAFGHQFHDSACGHDHSHAPAAAQTDAASSTDLSVPLVSALPDTAHDCPLCQFFGIAQWSGCFPPLELTQLSAAFRSPASESPRLTFVSRYQSRGPPLGASCI
jgi:hypothetical protein